MCLNNRQLVPNQGKDKREKKPLKLQSIVSTAGQSDGCAVAEWGEEEKETDEK